MSNELIEAMAQAIHLAAENPLSVYEGEMEALRQRQAQAAYAAIADRVVVKASAEPVAWMHCLESYCEPSLWRVAPEALADGWTETPLYAHPSKVDLAGVEELVNAARSFREAARQIRPHPANPLKVEAGAVARFVDVECASIAQRVDEAATALQSLAAQLAQTADLAFGFQQDTIKLATQLAEARDKALEEAAKVADGMGAEWNPTRSRYDAVRQDEAQGIATAIRALKGSQQ